jgi:hypothetical protein
MQLLWTGFSVRKGESSVSKKGKYEGKKCSCCEPGRLLDVVNFVLGSQYYHSDDGTEAEVEEEE